MDQPGGRPASPAKGGRSIRGVCCPSDDHQPAPPTRSTIILLPHGRSGARTYHPISSPGERRWILAEILGQVLLHHQLVDSTAPGNATIGLLEPQRFVCEREARASPRSFSCRLQRGRPSVVFGVARPACGGELSAEERVRRLADEFGVTPSAMRVRLEQMTLVR